MKIFGSHLTLAASMFFSSQQQLKWDEVDKIQEPEKLREILQDLNAEQFLPLIRLLEDKINRLDKLAREVEVPKQDAEIVYLLWRQAVEIAMRFGRPVKVLPAEWIETILRELVLDPDVSPIYSNNLDEHFSSTPSGLLILFDTDQPYPGRFANVFSRAPFRCGLLHTEEIQALPSGAEPFEVLFVRVLQIVESEVAVEVNLRKVSREEKRLSDVTDYMFYHVREGTLRRHRKW